MPRMFHGPTLRLHPAFNRACADPAASAEGRAECHHLSRAGMRECDFGGVEKKPRCRPAAIARVAQDRKAMLRGLRPNLMGPAGDRLGFDHALSASLAQETEPRLGPLSARMEWPANISLANARQRGNSRESVAFQLSIRH